MQRRQKSFWGPALLTLGLIGMLKFFHLDAKIPFLDQLLANQDPPGIIALLVLSFTLFCLLRLLFWLFAAIREIALIRQTQQALEDFTGKSGHISISVCLDFSATACAQPALPEVLRELHPQAAPPARPEAPGRTRACTFLDEQPVGHRR